MRVVAKKVLRAFWMKHNDCKEQLKTWHKETNEALWDSPNDIKKEYPSASIVAGNRVVFNIKGNAYRMVIKVNYKYKILWIRFIGTHKEYDKIDCSII